MATSKYPTLVASGSYGCIYSPAIPCLPGERIPPGYVSKVMFESAAQLEARVGKVLANIDPDQHAYIYLLPNTKCAVPDAIRDTCPITRTIEQRVKESLMTDEEKVLRPLARPGQVVMYRMLDGGNVLSHTIEYLRGRPDTRTSSLRANQYNGVTLLENIHDLFLYYVQIMGAIYKLHIPNVIPVATSRSSVDLEEGEISSDEKVTYTRYKYTVAHMDISVANIMTRERARLIDFGLALIMQDDAPVWPQLQEHLKRYHSRYWLPHLAALALPSTVEVCKWFMLYNDVLLKRTLRLFGPTTSLKKYLGWSRPDVERVMEFSRQWRSKSPSVHAHEWSRINIPPQLEDQFASLENSAFMGHIASWIERRDRVNGGQASKPEFDQWERDVRQLLFDNDMFMLQHVFISPVLALQDEQKMPSVRAAYLPEQGNQSVMFTAMERLVQEWIEIMQRGFTWYNWDNPERMSAQQLYSSIRQLLIRHTTSGRIRTVPIHVVVM